MGLLKNSASLCTVVEKVIEKVGECVESAQLESGIHTTTSLRSRRRCGRRCASARSHSGGKRGTREQGRAWQKQTAF